MNFEDCDRMSIINATAGDSLTQVILVRCSLGNVAAPDFGENTTAYPNSNENVRPHPGKY